jgi:hypothetical protein
MVARFDLKHVRALQEDKAAQYELALKLAESNIGISIEEAIRLVGLDVDASEMPFSQTRLVPNNLVPIETIAGKEGQGIDGALPLEPKQVVSLIDILDRVASGALDPEAAVQLIITAFPTIDEASAQKIVDGVNVIGPQAPPVTNPTNQPSGEGNPPADAPPPADTPPAVDPPPADEGKEIEPTEEALTREQPPSTRDASEEAFAARRAYWKAHDKATLAPGEATLRKVYLGKKGWRRKYEAAQLARIRSFAETGKTAAPVTRESDELGNPPAPRHVTESEVEKILLDRSEWAQKMSVAFEPHLRSIFNVALQDMADELSVDLLSPTDPRVVSFLSQQVIALANDHTGTLAGKVRGVLLEELAKAPSTGDLQSAVAEILPELTARASCRCRMPASASRSGSPPVMRPSAALRAARMRTPSTATTSSTARRRSSGPSSSTRSTPG